MAYPIYPCLWYDGQAKAAAEYYCGIFKDARIIQENPMVVHWEMGGSRFMGLNGGPQFKFSEAVSIVKICETQEEIDYYWDSLTANGGEESMCGWLKDKFGLSWQIVPSILEELMADPVRGQRAMGALMQMKKLDIEGLLNA